jgi:hypothetical protein
MARLARHHQFNGDARALMGRPEKPKYAVIKTAFLNRKIHATSCVTFCSSPRF